jgi:hypothetical protein
MTLTVAILLLTHALAGSFGAFIMAIFAGANRPPKT